MIMCGSAQAPPPGSKLGLPQGVQQQPPARQRGHHPGPMVGGSPTASPGAAHAHATHSSQLHMAGASGQHTAKAHNGTHKNNNNNNNNNYYYYYSYYSHYYYYYYYY